MLRMGSEVQAGLQVTRAIGDYDPRTQHKMAGIISVPDIRTVCIQPDDEVSKAVREHREHRAQRAERGGEGRRAERAERRKKRAEWRFR